MCGGCSAGAEFACRLPTPSAVSSRGLLAVLQWIFQGEDHPCRKPVANTPFGSASTALAALWLIAGFWAFRSTNEAESKQT